MCFFFFKQKTAYEMRISDWSSDVCSSDLALPAVDLQDEVVLLVEVERRDRVRRGDEDPASAVAHSRVDGFHTRAHAFEDFADQSAVNRIDLHVEQRRPRL